MPYFTGLKAYKMNKIENESIVVKQIEKAVGFKLSKCYTCGKCSAGCPAASFMTLKPHQIIRYLQLGFVEEIKREKSPWLCVSCETCTTRCPQGVDLAKVMDTLRNIFSDVEIPQITKVKIANNLFLENIKNYGRQYEFGLALNFNIKSKQFLKDISLGPKLFFKGKLSPLPHKNENLAKIQRIFQRVSEIRKGEGI